MKTSLTILLLLGATQSFAQGVPAPTLLPTYSSIHDLVFVPKCLMCHAVGQKAEDIPLEPYSAIMADGETVVASDPDSSSLVSIIERGKMPPRKSDIAPVTDEELAAIRTWIQKGATE